MAQVYTQYPNNAAPAASDHGSHPELKAKSGKAPHKDFVDHLVGFSLFNIIMQGIFPHVWFIGLISFFIFIGVVDAFVKFIKHPERDTYPYTGSEEKVKNAWIAYLIVRIVMSLIFHGFWVGEIAPAVLLINALEQTYMLIQTKKQQQKVVGQPSVAPAPAPIQVTVAPTPAPVYTAPASAPKFCAICGTPRESGAHFCSGCGYKFE